MIGTWHALVIDCEDPDMLASFYQEVLGMIRVQEDADWITVETGTEEVTLRKSELTRISRPKKEVKPEP